MGKNHYSDWSSGKNYQSWVEFIEFTIGLAQVGKNNWGSIELAKTTNIGWNGSHQYGWVGCVIIPRIGQNDS